MNTLLCHRAADQAMWARSYHLDESPKETGRYVPRVVARLTDDMALLLDERVEPEDLFDLRHAINSERLTAELGVVLSASAILEPSYLPGHCE